MKNEEQKYKRIKQQGYKLYKYQQIIITYRINNLQATNCINYYYNIIPSCFEYNQISLFQNINIALYQIILATLGPKFNTVQQIIDAVQKTNVKIFRINLSHGTPQDWLSYLQLVQKARKELQSNEIKVMGDIQGPKFRIGVMKNPIDFKLGDKIVFSSNQNVDSEIYLPHQEIIEAVQLNDKVILSDGELICQVVEKQINENNNYKLVCRCLCNGRLSSRKGISIPRHIESQIPTDVDKISIKFMDENDFDYCMMSFIQHEQDINIYKQQFKQNKHIKFITKIETVPAVENLEKIIINSDIIMIARGDLGVECGQHLVPKISDQIVKLCKKHNIMSLIATQFMIGELQNKKPNCAEINDIQYQIRSGVQGILLTQETAMNEQPVECLVKLQEIIQSCQ